MIGLGLVPAALVAFVKVVAVVVVDVDCDNSGGAVGAVAAVFVDVPVKEVIVVEKEANAIVSGDSTCFFGTRC